MQTKPAADPTPIVVGPASPYATSPDTLNSAARGSSSMRLETGEHVVFSWVSVRSAGLAGCSTKRSVGEPGRPGTGDEGRWEEPSIHISRSSPFSPPLYRV